MIYNMSYPRDDQVVAATAASARQPPTTRPAKPKTRPAALGEPLDPNELSRRLQIVLTEQKAKAEKKRRARAEAERRLALPPLAGIPVVRDIGAAVAKEKKSPPRTKPSDDSSSAGRPSIGEAGKPPSSKLVKTRKLSKADLAAEAEAAARGAAAYVPREAAAQFTRTTTAVSMRGSNAVHRLSAQALKSHDAAMERTRAVGKKPSAGGGGGSRLAFFGQHQQQPPRHSRILEEPPEAENDGAREEVLPTHRHTIEGHNLIRNPDHRGAAQQQQQVNPRRSSMGDVVDAEHARRQSIMLDFDDIDEEGPVDPAAAGEHRVDWTQSDEAHTSKSPRDHLRSKMSIWALRGRLGSLTKHNRDEKDVPVSPDEKQHRGGGFFARFKH